MQQFGGAASVVHFDPRQEAVLLLGGDKFGDWNAWYDEAIPQADQIYVRYLRELRREGTVE